MLIPPPAAASEQVSHNFPSLCSLRPRRPGSLAILIVTFPFVLRGGCRGGGGLAPHPAHFGHSGAGHSQLSLFTAGRRPALRRTVVACRIVGIVSHHSIYVCMYLFSKPLFTLIRFQTIQTYAFSETLFGIYWPDQPSLYGGDGCILSIYLVLDIDSCWS